MTDTDIAWCAGFFDGEGHVSYKRSYPSKTSNRVSPMIMCSVPQAVDNLEVLEFFQTTVGMGKIKGPYNTPGRDQYRLIFSVKEIEPLFVILKPYLKSEKTGDFQRALLGYLTHQHEATQEDYDRLIKHKTKKGLPIFDV